MSKIKEGFWLGIGISIAFTIMGAITSLVGFLGMMALGSFLGSGLST